MANPKLLILDEPSLGLAPLLVEQIRDIVVDINKSGVSVLLIEQNASMALAIADRAYVLETGRVVRDGTSAELRQDDEIVALYLGLSRDGSRSSYRETYARRRAATEATP